MPPPPKEKKKYAAKNAKKLVSELIEHPPLNIRDTKFKFGMVVDCHGFDSFGKPQINVLIKDNDQVLYTGTYDLVGPSRFHRRATVRFCDP